MERTLENHEQRIGRLEDGFGRLSTDFISLRESYYGNAEHGITGTVPTVRDHSSRIESLEDLDVATLFAKVDRLTTVQQNMLIWIQRAVWTGGGIGIAYGINGLAKFFGWQDLLHLLRILGG